jgi:hypothetical protein
LGFFSIYVPSSKGVAAEKTCEWEPRRSLVLGQIFHAYPPLERFSSLIESHGAIS